MSQPLTPKQLKILEDDLDALEVSLLELLVKTEASSKPVNLKDNVGRLSRMDEMHNQSILLANRAVTKNRLRQIKFAKQRLRDDVYGYCTQCDDDIALPRLKAYPEAPMCIVCQSKQENN